MTSVNDQHLYDNLENPASICHTNSNPNLIEWNQKASAIGIMSPILANQMIDCCVCTFFCIWWNSINLKRDWRNGRVLFHSNKLSDISIVNCVLILLITRYFIHIVFFFFFYFLQADDDPIHVISVADPPTVEKPPEYDTVVILEPPCYDEAIKLNPANLLQTKYYQDVSLPNYADLEITGNINGSSNTTTTTSSTVAIANTNNSQDQDNSQSNGVITTRNGTTNNSNSVSQTNENLSNSCNTSTVITIEQTASNLTNEHSITRKLNDCDSVASESSALS